MRLMLLVVIFGQSNGSQTPWKVHEEAVREYRAALETKQRDARLDRFHRAELLFKQVLASTSVNETFRANSDLLVNLGNAALGGERIGIAILAYRRALRSDPDHPRALQNLDHARSLLPSWLPQPEKAGFMDDFFSWRRRLSLSELQLLAAAVFLGAATMGAAAIRWHRAVLRYAAVALIVVWGVVLGVWLANWSADRADVAVVVAPEVIGRSADSYNAVAGLSHPLPAGTEVRLMEEREEWARVRLFDGRGVWLPLSSISRVVPQGS